MEEKTYNGDLFGITQTEYNLLADAVKQGLFSAEYLKSRIDDLKNYRISANELISMSDPFNEFENHFKRTRFSIEEDEFKKIAKEVIETFKDVKEYRITGAKLTIGMFSKRYNITWFFNLIFDDNGKITGNYWFTEGFENKVQPKQIGDIIARRIRSAMYE